MPTTLPGFLMVVGTILFVASLLKLKVNSKIISVSFQSDRARKILMVLGLVFMFLSVSLYAVYFTFADWEEAEDFMEELE